MKTAIQWAKSDPKAYGDGWDRIFNPPRNPKSLAEEIGMGDTLRRLLRGGSGSWRDNWHSVFWAGEK